MRASRQRRAHIFPTNQERACARGGGLQTRRHIGRSTDHSAVSALNDPLDLVVRHGLAAVKILQHLGHLAGVQLTTLILIVPFKARHNHILVAEQCLPSLRSTRIVQPSQRAGVATLLQAQASARARTGGGGDAARRSSSPPLPR